MGTGSARKYTDAKMMMGRSSDGRNFVTGGRPNKMDKVNLQGHNRRKGRPKKGGKATLTKCACDGGFMRRIRRL